MTVGVETKPIYQIEMQGVAWQLLWFLICTMNDDCTVDGGWRSKASESMGRDRQTVGIAARKLQVKGLIFTEPHSRSVKINVSAIKG